MKEPSLKEWKELYAASTRFKEIESWDWISDSDVFGVQNPENGQIGYCCIMGELGEMFALAVYLGTEGLEGYLKISSGEILPGNMDALTIQECLMASFEDREFLQKPDLEMIKKIGLKFRGRNNWPLFRSYRPGYFPWHLTDSEARYLTLALGQATEVALRFKEDLDVLTPPRRGHFLVRVLEKNKWKDEWLKPAPLKREELVVGQVNEVRLEKIKRGVERQGGAWEADFFYSPSAVKEKGDERPYYPYTFLLVDKHSGFILATHIAKLMDDYGLEFQEKFLSTIENTKLLPSEVLVCKEEAYDLLEPITSKLGIELILVDELEMLEEARDAMFNFFDGME